MFSNLFNTLFFKPILNFVIVVYNTMPDTIRNMGVVILVVIIFVRLILLPLTRSETKNRKLLKKLQESGKLKELDQYKKDPPVYMEKMKALYAKYDLNPMKGTFLSLLIQLPVFFALYKVFRMIMTNQDFSPYLYNGIKAPEVFDSTLFGVIDLANPSLALAIILGISQYLFISYGPTAVKKQKIENNTEAKVEKNTENVESLKTKDVAQNMNKMFKWFLPGLMFFIGVSLPAGITLYIIISLFVNWLFLAYMDKHIEKTVMSKYNFDE